MQALPFAMVALKAAGPIIKGIGGLKAGKAANKAAKAEARDIVNTGNAQALQVRDRARKAIGEQVAAQFSNGFLGGTGSALDYLQESQVNAALDVMEIRRQAESKAYATRMEGKAAARQGRYALAEGLLGAASSVAGGITDWANAKAPS